MEPIELDEAAVIDMYMGEVKVVRTGPVARVAVGNSKLLSTSALTRGQLVLLAESEGTTTVHIWSKDGSERDITVRITRDSAGLNAADAQKLLADVPGVAVREIGGKAVLTGTLDIAYAPRVETVLKAYPDMLDLTQKAQLTLPADKMIYMNVKITEFNRNKLDELGIDWDNPISGPAAGVAYDAVRNDVFRITPATPSFKSGLPIPLAGPVGYFGLVSEISSRINFLVNTGNALILAEPTLSARSGGEAEFLAGGEVPLKTTSSLGQTNVEFKEFGIKLTIAPVVDSRGSIMAKVATELSAIDPAVSVDGIPGFISRKTSTDISMREGETLVISGLINQETGQDIRKLKGLGDIPVIGALFRSEKFRNKQTELVIFVTPRVYDANSELNQARMQDRLRLIEDYKQAVEKPGLELLD